MGSSQETIALHLCARPRGNRKLRYPLRDYLPPSFPSSRSTSPFPLRFFTTTLPFLALIRGGNRPLFPFQLPLSSSRGRSCLSPGDVEVWRPRMQPAPRAEGAGVGVRLAKRVGQTERSIARTCFRHPRILPSTYNRPISVGARNTVACVCITYICIYV